jgi:2-keto-3-deoxy-L-arabinonate dehydratase
MKEGGVIKSDHVRHPQKPMTQRTRDRLFALARDMDLITMRWGH